MATMDDNIWFTEVIPTVKEAREAKVFDGGAMFRRRLQMYLPAWAYEAEAYRCIDAEDMWGVTRGLTLCYWGTGVLWVFFLLFSLLAVMTSSCNGARLALLPGWLGLTYLPVLIAHLGIEWKILRFLVVAQAMYTAPFAVFGKALEYKAWLLVAMTVSALGHADIVSTALVAAQVLKTSVCDCASTTWTIPMIWRHAIQESFLEHVPLISHFGLVFCMSWAMILLQLVYALLCTIPRDTGTNDEELEDNCDDEEPMVGKQAPRYDTEDEIVDDVRTFFDTVLVTGQSEPGAALHLAELNRMGAATFQDADYLKEASVHWNMNVICTHLQRTIAKFILFCFGESVLQMNLKAMLLALSAASRKLAPLAVGQVPDRESNVVIAASMGLTVLMFCLALVKAHSKIHVLIARFFEKGDCLDDVSDADSKSQIIGIYARGWMGKQVDPGFLAWQEAHRHTLSQGLLEWEEETVAFRLYNCEKNRKSLVARVRCLKNSFLIIEIVAVAMVIYALLTVVSASRCPFGVWSLTGGCANFDGQSV